MPDQNLYPDGTNMAALAKVRFIVNQNNNVLREISSNYTCPTSHDVAEAMASIVANAPFLISAAQDVLVSANRQIEEEECKQRLIEASIKALYEEEKGEQECQSSDQ